MRRGILRPVTAARRPSRNVLVAVAGGLAVAAVALAVAVTGGSSGGEYGGTSDTAASADKAELNAYEQAITPIVREGGRVVVEGLRPGIAALLEASAPDDQIETMTAGYVAELRQIRDQLLAVTAPASLGKAVERFEAAMDGYVRAAELLHEAARARGDERRALVDQVAAAGEAADEVYDQAWEIVNAEKRRLGLPVEELPE